ncbi:MAG: Zn finger protein HypA/HybF involved in hydrogenase expression [Chlamydiales bacterium]|jgi:Zn finger protein HypA/HybF involved in hydrogenase expression
MLKLSLSTAFMFYLGATLGVLLVLWIYYNMVQGRKKIVPYERSLFVCEYCSKAYLEESIKHVTKCPECQSFNKSG